MLAATVHRLLESRVHRALAQAGVTIGGTRPWDIRVHDPSFYGRLVSNPALQLGETYMDGLWDCDAIEEMVARLMLSGIGTAHEQGPMFHARSLLARVRNAQSLGRARQVATEHYDLDTSLYEAMLDSSMVYTCGYWRDGGSLEDAQQAKLRLICDKLDLHPGQTLLDIGCGFGGLAAFAARQYGVKVVAVTNSVEHHRVATARCRLLPVEVHCMDYRDIPKLGRRFDHISSIEMIEAVGPKNFATYMDIAWRSLVPGGRFLLQSFISPTSRQVCNEWFDRHIFPNGVSPSFEQLAKASRDNFGVPRHVDHLGQHYAPTLLAWDKRLRAAWGRPGLERYDARFRRMWHFYLTCLAGVFGVGDLQLCQIVYGDAPPVHMRGPAVLPAFTPITLSA